MDPNTTVLSLIKFYLYPDIFCARGAFKTEDIYQFIHTSQGMRPGFRIISIEELDLHQCMN